MHTIRMLEDMSKQIGKQEYQLCVGVLEETYHGALKFNAKEFRRILEKNWVGYQALKVRNFM